MRAELLEKRNNRDLPTPGDHEQAVQYLLNTETEEMSFEIARIKPCLTTEFLHYVQDAARTAKFDTSADFREDRYIELEALHEVVTAELKALEDKSQELISPSQKLKDLFIAKDKKQHILDLASRNEIDQQFLNLLKTNISCAKEAGQKETADYMEKLMDACERYSAATN